MKTPLLRDVPVQFETERLLIRCPRPGDGAIVYAGVVESLQALRAFPASLPWAMHEPSADESEKFCREGHANYVLRTAMPMLLFAKNSNTHIGNSGLHSFDWTVPKCEIGYWVRTSFARQGLITEAVKAITDFAVVQLGMQRIEALPDDENIPSCMVCERAGYRLEGILRNERIEHDGRLRNTRVYAYTNEV